MDACDCRPNRPGRVCDLQALFGSLAVGGDGRVGITRVLTVCAPQQGWVFRKLEAFAC